MDKYTINTADTRDTERKTSEKIKVLLQERNAVLLTHVYQRTDIQKISHKVSDSLELSRTAAQTDADIIVFCGVHFMAETAKLLSPEKKVLLPYRFSACPMADMITPRDLIDLKKQHPEAAVMCYVNSTAAVKAESHYCCTSSNAVDVAKAIPNKKIIFVPDRGLGTWVKNQVPEKEFIIYNGFCPTHYQIKVSEVVEIKRKHPEALILAHPECVTDVLEIADFIGSTTKIHNFAVNSKEKEFIVLSEYGLLDKMKEDMPDKNFYTTFPAPHCPNMKYNTLELVLKSLETDTFEVTVPEYGLKDGLFERARSSILNMFEVTEKTKKTVEV